jgi:hypothetical protein
VTYDAASVPDATGAVAEISTAGLGSFGSYATFNNPNGSERDDNGHDSGSVAWIPLKGTRGTATLTVTPGNPAAGTIGMPTDIQSYVAQPEDGPGARRRSPSRAGVTRAAAQLRA